MVHKLSLDLKDVSFNEPVLVNTISGEVFSIPEKLLLVEGTQVLVIGIPCNDFPMLLAEKEMLPLENLNQF